MKEKAVKIRARMREQHMPRAIFRFIFGRGSLSDIRGLSNILSNIFYNTLFISFFNTHFGHGTKTPPGPRAAGRA